MIEAALGPDGRPMADEYLAELEASRKVADQEALATIIMRFENYAHRDALDFPREINDLRDGIREIKPGKHRFPFFHPIEGSTYKARLTHGFYKRQQKTPRREINLAFLVRRKDLEA